MDPNVTEREEPNGDEAGLIARIRAGDAAAFESVYTRYASGLVQYAEIRLGSRDAAKDVVHDVLMQCWQRRAALNVRGALRVYLYGAVTRRIAHVRRHEAVVRESEMRVDEGLVPGAGQPPLPPDRALTVAELEREIRGAVQALSDRDRTVLALRTRGLSYQEISAVLGVTAEAAQKQGRRMLEKLRRRIQGEG